MSCKSHNENFAEAPFGSQNKRFGCFCKETVLFVFILVGKIEISELKSKTKVRKKAVFFSTKREFFDNTKTI